MFGYFDCRDMPRRMQLELNSRKHERPVVFIFDVERDLFCGGTWL